MHSSSTSIRKERIKDLPLSSRPREKLLLKGSENITDAELIAILLGTGTKEHNAVVVAANLLQKYSLKTLAQVTVAQLQKIPGIGKVKALHIHAALELGKRVFSPVSITKTIIYDTKDAVAVCREFASKKQEYMVVLYLNARHELLQKEIIGMGSLNALVIEPKEIFSHAVVSPCAEIIIVHNHPSGDPTPSEEDISFTSRVQKAGEIMGILLLDHVILSSSGYFSFRDEEYAKE
ncbi:MAG TPA: DNA repair protein RadC [Candidatus Saccharimonadales bacterium]|nr:DNA repair protein RadC [Candidatus Saccharimonadales bacterium]